MSAHTNINIPLGGPGFGSSFGAPIGTPLSPILTSVATGIGSALVNTLLPGDQGPTQAQAAGNGATCEPLPPPGLPPGMRWSAKKQCWVKARRRRKRMLTCTDKSDIGFLIATMGKGEMAKSAIGALLSRSCS